MLAMVAHLEMRQHFRALMAGPRQLPKRRRLFGLLSNPRYNKRGEEKLEALCAQRLEGDDAVSIAYFVNAGGDLSGLAIHHPARAADLPVRLSARQDHRADHHRSWCFDGWRGIRAGDDARLAREREVSVYRNLDI